MILSVPAALLMGIASYATSAQAVTGSELWNQYSTNPNNHSNIPNNSFAGYRRGEAPLPNSTQVNSVKDFGAKGDGVTDDTIAFTSALNDAAAKGGGTVFVPSGTYKITSYLNLKSNNVILKGESRSTTTLDFTRRLSSIFGVNGNQWSWSGGLIWIGPGDTFNSSGQIVDWSHSTAQKWEYWRPGSVIANVTGTHTRGATSVTVDNAAGLAPGMMVMMTWKNTSDYSLLKHVAGHPLMDGFSWSNAELILPASYPEFQWPVEIKSVSGNTVTLAQPIRLDIRSAWSVSFKALGNHVREVGIQNLKLKLHAPSDHTHFQDGGWNGIYINRAYNCFVDNVEIQSSSNGIILSAAKQVTVNNVLISGSETQHHCMACRVNSHDCLFQNFNITDKNNVYHGINIEWFSSGNVWSKGTVTKGTFDSHRAMGFDAIRTDISINNDVGNAAGAAGAGPFLGRRVVHWNDRITGSTRRATFVYQQECHSMGALVGMQGANVSTAGCPAMVSGNKGVIIADHGVVPNPANLYEAQKQLRLQGSNIAPAVNITSPAHGASFSAPANVTISATAADSNGTVTKVEFLAGTILLGTDTSSPYSMAWNSVASGSYSLTARATDNGGLAATSSAVAITVHASSTTSTGPFSAKVNFQPATSTVPSGYVADTGAVYGARGNGHTYGWNADNSANSRDRNSAASPDERYDTLNHMQRNGTFSWELAVPNGTYNVHAVCGDPGFTDSVFKLNVEGVLTVSGTPTTSSFWVEGTSTVTVADGRLSVTVGTGGTNVKINFIEVTGADAPVNPVPTVNLTSPVTGATYTAPASIAMSATAADSNGSVSKVDFLAGTTLVATDSTSPYGATWSAVPAGAYVLTARATDNEGASATSSTVNITVNASSSTTSTPPSGSLVSTKAGQPTSLSLNVEGSRDWAHWGLNAATDWNHKSGVTSQISNITRVGTGTVNRYTDGTMAVSWTGGTPTASASSTRAGIYVAGDNNGFQVTVPADTTSRTLKVYCGLWKSQGKLEATLSDGSAPAVVDTTHGSTTGSANTMFTLNYQAASAGQTLTVRWTVQTSHDTAGAGTVGWQAATLQ